MTDSEATLAQSVQHEAGAQTVPGSSLGHSLLFDQNLGTCNCEQIRKKTKIQDCVITVSFASVINNMAG